jgi:hypothetical protein
MRHGAPPTALVLLSALMLACGPQVDGVSPASVDRGISGASRFPVAADPSRVGKYSGRVKSGAGYFYDDVLEHRVWLHPERGAKPLAGDRDYFAAFAEYERAAEFAKSAQGSEEPLVLIRQREWIDEPSPGHYTVEKGDRPHGVERRVRRPPGTRRARRSDHQSLHGSHAAAEGASRRGREGRRRPARPIRSPRERP